MPRFPLTLLCVVLAGCTSNLEKDYSGARHYELGMQAEQAGDLANARKEYDLARQNARSGHLGPAKEAHACFAWARITGYIGGMSAESERGFIETLALIDKAEGDADSLRVPALFEYSLLLHDTGQHAKAVPIYRAALAGLDRIGASKIEPLAYAGFLDGYAESLRATGLGQPAAEIAQATAAIRRQHPGEKEQFSVRRYKK
jgi:hypothetical protein